MKFNGLLFDMDGVLVDNMQLHFQAWVAFVAKYGISIGQEDLRHLVDARRNVEILPVLFGKELAEDELHAFVKEKEAEYRRLARIQLKEVPGARDFLESACNAGVPTALGTAASEENVSLIMDTLGFRKYFQVCVTAKDVSRGKPHPEVYLKAASLLGLEAKQCLVVEDAVLGVQAAKAAGAYCLALSTSHAEAKLKNAGADWVSKDFKVLPPELSLDLFFGAKLGSLEIK